MLKAINLILRFLLELIILFALGYWGFHYDSILFVQIVLGLGLPLITAVIWGKFISPKATIRLPIIGVFIIELLIFIAAFLCLLANGFNVFAIIFIVVSIVNRYIIIKFNQGIES